MRSVFFNDKSWRRLLPSPVYTRVHAMRFRGANRLRRLLGLQPRDVEEAISAHICRLTEANSLFLDIGAQHGRHTHALLEAGDSTAVAVAFEANPELAVLLDDSLREAVQARRATVVPCAVADTTGEAEFFVNTFDTGYSGLRRREIAETRPCYKTVRVRQTTVDEASRTWNLPVSCIKIDVEGAELRVLQGSERVLQDNRPCVLFECAANGASFYGYGLQDIVEWLAARGFSVFTIHGVEVSIGMAQECFLSKICLDFVAVPAEKQEFLLRKIKEAA